MTRLTSGRVRLISSELGGNHSVLAQSCGTVLHMEVGEYVIDADDDDPDLAVVVHCPDATIDDIPVSLESDRTVADDNPDYPADDPAVQVAFVESGLDRQWQDWTDADPTQLHDGVDEHDIKLYTFPASRLRTVPEEKATAMTTEATVDMEGLKARLADADWTLESRDDGSLTAEKMGEQYRIFPSGTVEGEGQIRDPIENIVEQYIE